jgi:hypothetical protein
VQAAHNQAIKMEDIIDVGWGTKVEVCFNEYNHKTKKRIVVERQVSRSDIREINNQLDSTDSGEFLEVRIGDVTLSGHFTLLP